MTYDPTNPFAEFDRAPMTFEEIQKEIATRPVSEPIYTPG
jgi:hypothetical protein